MRMMSCDGSVGDFFYSQVGAIDVCSDFCHFKSVVIHVNNFVRVNLGSKAQ